MRLNTFLILTLLALINSSSYAQEHETVLSAPDNWQSEIIPFPLGFAQEIEFTGFEDLRFAPEWSNPESPNFWTYTFVWYIDTREPMTEEVLTTSFHQYYDGLMNIKGQNEADTSGTQQLDPTICLFVKTKEGFTGKMRVYDNFFTKSYITLNIKVRESFCPKTNKQIVYCDISKQPFGHEVWRLFDQVQLKAKCK